jgi:hypothetical protein
MTHVGLPCALAGLGRLQARSMGLAGDLLAGARLDFLHVRHARAFGD